MDPVAPSPRHSDRVASPGLRATGLRPVHRRDCLVIQSGVVAYDEALIVQESLAEERRAGRAPDMLWLLEHPHTYSVGRSARGEDFLKPLSEYRRLGAAIFDADRGGGITYHGPGQLVAYPIIDLGKQPDLHDYLRRLEQAIIDCLAVYEISAGRRSGLTGVWAGRKKVASIGVKVSRGIAKHGVSINVDCDPAHFRLIRPCGLDPADITTMAELLGNAPSVASVGRSLAEAFGRIFGLELESAQPRGINPRAADRWCSA